jgi:hypothetical protein
VILKKVSEQAAQYREQHKERKKQKHKEDFQPPHHILISDSIRLSRPPQWSVLCVHGTYSTKLILIANNTNTLINHGDFVTWYDRCVEAGRDKEWRQKDLYGNKKKTSGNCRSWMDGWMGEHRRTGIRVGVRWLFVTL